VWLNNEMIYYIWLQFIDKKHFYYVVLIIIDYIFGCMLTYNLIMNGHGMGSSMIGTWIRLNLPNPTQNIDKNLTLSTLNNNFTCNCDLIFHLMPWYLKLQTKDIWIKTNRMARPTRHNILRDKTYIMYKTTKNRKKPLCLKFQKQVILEDG